MIVGLWNPYKVKNKTIIGLKLGSMSVVTATVELKIRL